jgi:release factor glutamine methyltransferase
VRPPALVETVAGLLAEGTRALRAAGLPDASRDAAWLLADLVGLPRLALPLEPDRAVPPPAPEAFRARIARRGRGEPLQQIVGFDDFRGLRLRTGPEALIPRPETEGMVEWALSLEAAHGPWRLAVDVGTGTGAIACALARPLPGLRVVAVERSLGALALAAENIRALGLGERVRLVAGDLLAPLAGLPSAVDVVVANLPYIPTADLHRLPAEVRGWEPEEALDGGPDGTAVQRRLIPQSLPLLRPGGWLLMEMGEGQAGALRRLMEAAGFGAVEVRRDLAGRERMIAGRRP